MKSAVHRAKKRPAQRPAAAPKKCRPAPRQDVPLTTDQRSTKPSPSEASETQAPTQPLKARWPAKDLAFFRRTLLEMRDRLTGQIACLKTDSLTREDAVATEEDGTDAFERQFALSLARLESNSVAEIDEALRRIDLGTYGVCEGCGDLIGRARLAALPFVRLCVECKAREEKGRPRFVALEKEPDKLTLAPPDQELIDSGT